MHGKIVLLNDIFIKYVWDIDSGAVVKLEVG